MDFKKGCIGVVPFGEIPEIALRDLVTHIHSCFNLRAVVLPPMPYPPAAYDERRKQYNAATIIKALESMPFQGCDKIIGVLNMDLFIPIFTYVMGEAQEGGKYALASMFRLRRGHGRTMPLMEKILQRLSKVALHEIGHLFNVGHCMDEKCLMHFSGSLQDLDSISLNFCAYCSEYLRDAIRRQIPSGLEKPRKKI